jgi:excinuclease ABC subunit A
VLVAVVDGEERLYSEKMACMDCGVNIPTIEPRTFSFNSVYGACPTCHGLGVRFDFDPSRIVADPSRPLLQGGLAVTNTWLDDELEAQARRVSQQLDIDIAVPFEQLSPKQQQQLFYGSREKRTKVTGIVDFLNEQNTVDNPISEDLGGFMVTRPCVACNGTRLKPESLAVRVGGKSIAEVVSGPISETIRYFAELNLGARERLVADRIVREIRDRLEFLQAVGLNYLSLDRSANTLSGGESQRIRLATQIGSRLRGVLYVLDEPSIGLHHKDNSRLLATLQELRDLGNTVVVVEHDE